jgi:Flp pilus assembly protein TadD
VKYWTVTNETVRAWPIAGLLLLAACANQASIGGGGSGPRDGVPSTDVAEAALRGGSPQIALRIDDAILAKDPRNAAALLNRGDAQTALQQFDGAMESYAGALEADRQSIAARIGLGRLRLRADPGAAESLFLEVLQRDPRNAVALNDVGIARDLLGRHDDAQVAYRQAIGVDATMTGAQVNLALSLAMAGRADDAAPLLRPLASAPAAPRKLRHDMAAVLAMGGDRSAAQRILAEDLPPNEVDKALSIFIAATAPSTTAHAVGGVSASAIARPNSAPAGGLMVELSSEVSSAAAEAAWTRLRQQMPDLLADRQPILLRSENAGLVVWRLRTAGFTGAQDAEGFCRAAKARGVGCVVTGA